MKIDNYVFIISKSVVSLSAITILYPTYDVDQRYSPGKTCDIALWLGQYCPVVQLTTVCRYLACSGQTQTSHLYVLRGYKPVNTPLQVLYGIMHSCVTTYSPRASPSCSMWLLHSCIIFLTALVEVYYIAITNSVQLGYWDGGA